MPSVVRVHADSEHCTAEYTILVRSDLKGHGLGWPLMELMIDYPRWRSAVHSQSAKRPPQRISAASLSRPNVLTKLVACSCTAAVWRSLVANLDFATQLAYVAINATESGPLWRGR